jgi:hypothetical protein
MFSSVRSVSFQAYEEKQLKTMPVQAPSESFVRNVVEASRLR